jgi:hypothetical protein
VTPTDPQGAGETRVEWRNVYREASGVRASHFTHLSREQADQSARYATAPRIAIERIETHITRIPVREEGV